MLRDRRSPLPSGLANNMYNIHHKACHASQSDHCLRRANHKMAGHEPILSHNNSLARPRPTSQLRYQQPIHADRLPLSMRDGHPPQRVRPKPDLPLQYHHVSHPHLLLLLDSLATRQHQRFLMRLSAGRLCHLIGKASLLTGSGASSRTQMKSVESHWHSKCHDKSQISQLRARICSMPL